MDIHWQTSTEHPFHFDSQICFKSLSLSLCLSLSHTHTDTSTFTQRSGRDVLPELAPWHKTEHVLLLSVYLASGDRRANRVWVCVKNIQRQIRPGRKSRRRERGWHGASQRGRPEHCTLFTCRFIRRVSYQRSDGKLLCVWSAVVASLYTNENLSVACSHEDKDVHCGACKGPC